MDSGLDFDYFFGRSAMAVTSYENTSTFAFPSSDVQDISETFEITTFYCDLEDEESVKDLVEKVLKCLEICIQYRNGISPLMLRTADPATITTTKDLVSQLLKQ